MHSYNTPPFSLYSSPSPSPSSPFHSPLYSSHDSFPLPLYPQVGIWSSAIVGGIVAIVGGGPGIIAGASGVVALPMAKLVAAHGTGKIRLNFITFYFISEYNVLTNIINSSLSFILSLHGSSNHSRCHFRISFRHRTTR